MTWAEIVTIEPRLKDLYDEACSVKDDKTKKSFCANWIWYERFKPRLKRLAGYGVAYAGEWKDRAKHDRMAVKAAQV